MTHPVAVSSHDGFLIAWVLDLPGCQASGNDEATLEAMLPLTIAEHLSWLAGHGEPIDASTHWTIVERVDANDFADIGGEFCFEAERAPIAVAELDGMIAGARYARADLIAATVLLPDVVLDWAPPASAFDRFDAWAPEVRTIRDVERHTLQLEVYYRGGLRDGAAPGIFERVEDATSEHARTVELLRSLDDEQRSRVYWPVRPGRSVAEPWTVRKVLRRLISHERAHTVEIVQRRAWLLLGVPRATAV